ncbi:hypothetical protein CHS0354_022375 [Potamilus streckersoni]|uniref:Uncharacterized protein n=1 Tax=Potamilus streckersoni TaxID=2493646 RepID=A0AAE0SX27_9BIVA|nr:hypothetical protein CHS0354_022375 [Potamilus streckersoni]
MKSCVSNDVGISITLTNNDPVEHMPAFLQSAILADETEDSVVPLPAESVILPERYQKCLDSNCKMHVVKNEDNAKDREKDLDTALKWIKQEMILMKLQDRALMKQFIHLRSGIIQLRCLYELNSSNSDNSFDGSNLSLDGSITSISQNGYLSSSELEPIEFRGRTSSLLTPKRTHSVTRIKWASNEYI